MADELWDEQQNLALGREDPELFIHDEVYAAVVASNRLSMIARPLNPRAQNLFSVVSSLPRTWGLDSRVHGRVLDGNYVQFLFQSENDLISVQRRAPWVFNNWFVAAQRWEDIPDVEFLTSMELWVQLRSIPCLMCVKALLDWWLKELGRSYCPYGIPLPTQRDVADEEPRMDRERCALRDDLHRSDLNFQSQNSEYSFPAPIATPPRVTAPPPNADELEAAMPWFRRSRGDIPQSASKIQQISTGSNYTPNLDYAVTFKLEVHTSSTEAGDASKRYEMGEPSRRFDQGESSHRYEGGDSSKRKHGAVNESARGNPKLKAKDHMIGGILKPSKKR
ncbi:hypothetical protein ISN44_As11g027670 [Arabidopsis suecica]|uniref:DUF4283 domain-containing protein n=1 Tax=Arabidopsis suecica TaxID=45249 RepID=A0A8T1ZCR1_ARASU|nr:hypothetical protein ISN44_As11g027670 [Arabidopsis suecica]